MASIVKIGGVWRVQVAVKGMRSSATFANKPSAKQWAKQEEEKFRNMALSIAFDRNAPNKMRSRADVSELRSEGEIISKSEPLRSNSGIYFLIKNSEIVYVGQSVDVYSRMACHRREKEFDRFHIIPCEKEHLLEIEAKYIAKFNPKLNVLGRSDRMTIEEIESCLQ